MAVKKKKEKKANNMTQVRCHCMRRLIKTYTVWELINKSGTNKLQTVLKKKKKKKKKKKTGAFKRCIL